MNRHELNRISVILALPGLLIALAMGFTAMALVFWVGSFSALFGLLAVFLAFGEDRWINGVRTRILLEGSGVLAIGLFLMFQTNFLSQARIY